MFSISQCDNFLFFFRDYFYQFGEIRSIHIPSGKGCAFVAYTTRVAAEFAAERSFNKAIVQGKRLKVLWGRSQEERTAPKDKEAKSLHNYAPVPGLPGGKFVTTVILNIQIFVEIFFTDWSRESKNY